MEFPSTSKAHFILYLSLENEINKKKMDGFYVNIRKGKIFFRHIYRRSTISHPTG